MMILEQIMLIAQLGSTLPLVGLIWTIQVVHYPLFALVGESAQAQYQKVHMDRITWVVGPLMLVELVATGTLWALAPLDPLALGGALLLTVIWISTAFFQVPCHGRLLAGFDQGIHRRLVTTNWIRTAAWTARGVIVVLMGISGL